VTVLLLAKKEKIKITEEHIREGLKEKLLDSRFENIYSKKYKINVIFDTAHNYHAFKALIKNLKFIEDKYKRKVLVLGVLKDKNYKKILKVVLPYFDFIYITEPKSARKLDASVLLKEINKLIDVGQPFRVAMTKCKAKALPYIIKDNNFNVEIPKLSIFADVNYENIMKNISSNFNKNDLIVISGSFYTVGGFKKNI
jgi:folylpolyglutamate synthase/dihydropteroate synthase